MRPPGCSGRGRSSRGLQLQVARTDEGDLPEPRDYAFAVALGSGATARGDGPPWVADEIEWLRAADAAGLPILGICFGAQALAAALGGSVHRLPKPEIGWVTVETRDPDRLPAGPGWPGTRTASRSRRSPTSSRATPSACRRSATAATSPLQFHPEVTPAIVADWAADDHGDLERAGTRREDLEMPAGVPAAAEILFDGFAARAGLAGVASRA